MWSGSIHLRPMSPVTPGQRKKAIRTIATRLKFPQLFAVMAGLFVFDVFVPDLIPFVDEILLGLGTALFGLWREQVEPAPESGEGAAQEPASRPAGERPMKDITPPEEAGNGTESAT